jgi:nucleoside-diphosphate-sugar epimerase
MFSYIHMADACSIARKAIEADYAGHETFWAVAGDTTADEPTADVVAEFYPDAEVREELEGHETLFDLSKAADLLDWTPEHSWRDF